MARFPDDESAETLTGQRQERVRHVFAERRRWGKLHEERSAPAAKTICLFDELPEQPLHSFECVVVCDDARHFDGKAEIGGCRRRPFRVRRTSMRAMERRVDLGTVERARITFEMSALTGAARYRRPRNAPSGGADSDAHATSILPCDRHGAPRPLAHWHSLPSVCDNRRRRRSAGPVGHPACWRTLARIPLVQRASLRRCRGDGAAVFVCFSPSLRPGAWPATSGGGEFEAYVVCRRLEDR